MSPALPKEKTFAELSELLTKHYDPEPILIAERFHFYRRNQRSGESIAEYLACFRRMASRCKFGAFLSEALRDRLVCGMASENTQKVLLTKANLTLKKAIEISQGMEATAQQSKELKGSQRSTPVLAVETPAPAVVGVDVGNTLHRNVNLKPPRVTSAGKSATSRQPVAPMKPRPVKWNRC